MIKLYVPAALMLFVSCSERNNETSKSYQAGFTTIHIVDSSRIYKPETDSTDYLHYRPIDADIWYPASSASDTQLSVRSFLSLLETRANYYSASNIGNGVTTQLAQFFCEAFKCSDTSKLLGFKTNSFKNARAANGKFPLVIYMTAYNGMSYENFSLFEALSKKGFIVVSISSIGRFPGDMTMKKEDLMEQVNDAVITLKELTKNPDIDLDKVGIVGYSWGGLAGAVLANKIPNAQCLVSFEGSEFHHYGNEKNEDTDFDNITSSDEFKNMHLTIPYLRLESAPSVNPGKTDSVYKFYPYKINNARIFTIDSMHHEDFDCFSLVVKNSGNCADNQRYSTALNLAVRFLEDNLNNENHFSETVAGMKNVKERK